MSSAQPRPASDAPPTRVTEALTVATAPAVQRQLRDALASHGPDLVVDLAQVQNIDSTGIGLLIAASNSVIALQGQLRLINVPPDLFNLFKTMHLVDRFHAEVASSASDDSEEDLERYFEEAQTV